LALSEISSKRFVLVFHLNILEEPHRWIISGQIIGVEDRLFLEHDYDKAFHFLAVRKARP
jgi:hypothetical protein